MQPLHNPAPPRPLTPMVMPTDALREILPDEPIKPSDEQRLKIEYVPVSRPLDTYGGRSLEDIDRKLLEVQSRRQVKSHEELGACLS